MIHFREHAGDGMHRVEDDQQKLRHHHHDGVISVEKCTVRSLSIAGRCEYMFIRVRPTVGSYPKPFSRPYIVSMTSITSCYTYEYSTGS